MGNVKKNVVCNFRNVLFLYDNDLDEYSYCCKKKSFALTRNGT